MHAAAPSRRAFTLVELTVSLAVASLLLAALGSLMMSAARAVPTGTSPAERTIAASATLDQLTADLTMATAITQAGANTITVTVPDRTGDAVPDTIQYAWAATPGTPLYRQVNFLAPLAVLPAVQEFELDYTRRATTRATTSSSESSAAVLASVDPTLLTSQVVPNGSTGYGQTFRPTLPAGATSWSITRVGVRLRDEGSQDGITRVSIRPVDPATGVPTGPVIAEGTINETTLNSSSSFRYVSTPSATGLPVNTTFAVLVTSASGTRPSRLTVATTAAGSANQRYLTTSNNGATWTSNSLGAMNIEVTGTATTASTGTSSSNAIERVLIRLRTSASAHPIEASARLINRPDAPAM